MSKYIFVFIALFSSTILVAQSIEIGGVVGVMTYYGDLNPSPEPLSLNKFHPSIGGTFRVNLNDFFAFRMMLLQGTISGDDARSDVPNRRKRNLHFKSALQELSIVGEFNVLRFSPAKNSHHFTIFLFGGGGLFHFNPKAKYEENWVELQPLGTEGQFLDANSSYQRWDVSVLAGGGLKYAINANWIIGVEIGGHLTFNDYLDDVSTNYPDNGVLLEEMGEVAAALSDRRREFNPDFVPDFDDHLYRGTPDYADYFLTGGVSLSYRMVTSKTRRKQIRQARNRCPWN